jgi:hypothetical protein
MEHGLTSRVSIATKQAVSMGQNAAENMIARTYMNNAS